MKKINKLIFLIIIGLIAISIGMKFNEHSFENSNSEIDKVYSIKLPNINEEIISLSKYKNKWILINFWATWCAPCIEEIPELNNFFHKKHNIAIVGIAIDELELVKQFNKDIPIYYESLISDMDGVTLSKNLGNDKGVLPFSVVIDPNGDIKKGFYGKVTKEDLDSIVTNFNL